MSSFFNSSVTSTTTYSKTEEGLSFPSFTSVNFAFSYQIGNKLRLINRVKTVEYYLGYKNGITVNFNVYSKCIIISNNMYKNMQYPLERLGKTWIGRPTRIHTQSWIGPPNHTYTRLYRVTHFYARYWIGLPSTYTVQVHIQIPANQFPDSGEI